MTTKITGSVLANTAVTIGTYGGLTQIPVITIDQQGRATYAANVAISGITISGGQVTSIANTQITGLITSSQIATVATTQLTGTITSGQIASITSSQVTTALGFTPYNATNPAGYTTNLGTVTSVTGTSPVVSSGGTTPVISMPAATASVNGYMTSTYANKLDGIATGATNVTNTNQLTNGAGYITGITSGNVTTALGFTPYNATNPNGYLTSSGAVTSLNGQTGAITNTSVDAIGSYIFALNGITASGGGVTSNIGTTLAGTALRYNYTNQINATATNTTYVNGNNSIGYGFGGTALSGTWRVMSPLFVARSFDGTESAASWSPGMLVRIS